MIEVPVTVGFNPNDVIGVLVVNEDKLPNTPDYHFALHGQILEFHVEDGKKIIDKFKLLGISIVKDANFLSMGE